MSYSRSILLVLVACSSLFASINLTGRIVDETGNPLSGFPVSLVSHPSISGRTNAMGRFTLVDNTMSSSDAMSSNSEESSSSSKSSSSKGSTHLGITTPTTEYSWIMLNVFSTSGQLLYSTSLSTAQMESKSQTDLLKGEFPKGVYWVQARNPQVSNWFRYTVGSQGSAGVWESSTPGGGYKALAKTSEAKDYLVVRGTYYPFYYPYSVPVYSLIGDMGDITVTQNTLTVPSLNDTTVKYGGRIPLRVSLNVPLLAESCTWTSSELDSITVKSCADSAFLAPTESKQDTIYLLVQDKVGRAIQDTFVVTALNEKPIARAGSDRVVSLGDKIELDGSASTDDQGVESCLWTINGGIQISSCKAKYTITSGLAETVSLLVKDKWGAYSTDTIVLVKKGSVLDPRNGTTYGTIAIGSQVWMSDNLSLDLEDATRSTCLLGDCAKYGMGYTWAAAMNGGSSTNDPLQAVQGICPDGWHVPTGYEAIELTNLLNTRYSRIFNEQTKVNPDAVYDISPYLWSTGEPNGLDSWGLNLRSHPVDGENWGSFWVSVNDYGYGTGWTLINGIYYFRGGTNSFQPVRCLMDPVYATAPIPTYYSGSYSQSFSLDFSAEMNAIIRYSQDGLEPNSQSPIWSGSKEISKTTLIKFFAEVPGKAPSPIQSELYVISPNTFVDSRDNHSYAWVEFAGMKWMRQNLNYHSSSMDVHNCGEELPRNCESLGALYSWNQAMDADSLSENMVHRIPSGIRGICPEGWHLPSLAEWKATMDTLKYRFPGKSIDEMASTAGLDFLPQIFGASVNWSLLEESGPYWFNYIKNDGFSSYWTSSIESVPYRAAFYKDSLEWQYDMRSRYSLRGVRCIEDFEELDPPLIVTPNGAYKDSVQVEIIAPTGVQIHYTLDGLFPDENAPLYQKPITILANSHLTAVGYEAGKPPRISVPSHGYFWIGDTVITDSRDGQKYSAVRKGNALWFNKNLSYDTLGANVCPDLSVGGCLVGGRRYNQPTALAGAPYSTSFRGIRGLCPEGWHVPSHGEWAMVKDTLVGQSAINAIQGIPDMEASHIDAWETTEGTIWRNYRNDGFTYGSRYKLENAGIRCVNDYEQALAPVPSVNSSAFIQPFSLTLSAASPEDSMVYSLDEGAFVAYSGALMISSTTRIRVRSYAKGKVPSHVKAYYYHKADGIMTDSRDQNQYGWVKLGGLRWLAENLRYLPPNSNAVCSPVDSSANCAAMGRLYSNAEALLGASASNEFPSGVQGICPTGWHIPSVPEWNWLTEYAAEFGQAGNVLRAPYGWDTYAGPGLNTIGFNMEASKWSQYLYMDQPAFWTTQQDDSHQGYLNIFQWNGTSFDWSGNYNSGANASVRCVEDFVAPPPVPASWVDTFLVSDADYVIPSPGPQYTIRYTLDGTLPTKQSPEYSMPIPLSFRELSPFISLKARVFDQSGISSTLYERKIRFADGFITDSRDQEKYPYITFGAKDWFVSNLRYKNDGNALCYENNADYCQQHGLLYSFQVLTSPTATDEEKAVALQVCPAGWRVPSQTDWEDLFSVASQYGQSAVILLQENSGSFGTNLLGFSADYAGLGTGYGRYYGAGDEGSFASTSFAGTNNFVAYFDKSYYNARISNVSGEVYVSVRCVREH